MPRTQAVPSDPAAANRQAAILAGALLGSGAGSSEYEIEFEVDRSTIQRDLNALRRLGFDLHSVKNRITLIIAPSAELLRGFWSKYLRDIAEDTMFSRQLDRLLHHSGQYAFTLLVDIAHAIREHRMMRVTHRDVIGEHPLEPKRIAPVALVPTHRDVRLIGWEPAGARFKQYLLNRIASVELLDAAIEVPYFDIGRFYESSWEFWSSEERHRVVVRFSPVVAEYVASRDWGAEQMITCLADGSLEWSVTVNGFDEIASWLAWFGERAEVLEPPGLRRKLIEMAEGILKRHAEKSGTA